MKNTTFLMRFKSAKRQAGLTLIELIASLAILALVIGGALSLYTSASNSQATTQTVSDFNSLRAAVKGLYIGQGTFASVNNLVLVSAGKVPSTIAVAGPAATPTLTTSFSGAVTIAGTAPTFTISTTLVPRPVCIGLLSSATGWTAITVNAVAVPMPVTPGAAAAACPAAPTTVVLTSN